MVDQMVLHQQYSLILEVASHHLYPCLGQSHRIVIDDKEVRVVDEYYLMHVCIVGKNTIASFSYSVPTLAEELRL